MNPFALQYLDERVHIGIIYPDRPGLGLGFIRRLIAEPKSRVIQGQTSCHAFRTRPALAETHLPTEYDDLVLAIVSDGICDSSS